MAPLINIPSEILFAILYCGVCESPGLLEQPEQEELRLLELQQQLQEWEGQELYQQLERFELHQRLRQHLVWQRQRRLPQQQWLNQQQQQQNRLQELEQPLQWLQKLEQQQEERYQRQQCSDYSYLSLWLLRRKSKTSKTSDLHKCSDKLHPTLSSFLENMNDLDYLIHRLHDLAPSGLPEHRPQLLANIAVLRAGFKKQQERFTEYVQLTEEYANKYLLDISAEIQKRSTVLDNLKERLEAAKRIHGDVVDLQMFYESGTVASMKDLRATGIRRPLPEDNDLFDEVDFVMSEIGQSYRELNNFWEEETRNVTEVLKKGRTDPRDFNCWNNFHSSLTQTIEFWKNQPTSGDAQTLRSNNTSYSTGIDLGAIASSLSPTIGSLKDALERMFLSTSLQYSRLGQSSFQRVYIAFAGNNDLCLSLLRHCADYGKKVISWCLSIASSTSSRVGVPYDFRERTAELLSEATSVSRENAPIAQGSRRCKIAYNKVLTLEQKTTSGLNILLEILSSWASVTDGPSDDAAPVVVILEQLSEVKLAWEKARDSVRAAQATLTSETPRRVALTDTGSAFKRWMKCVVCLLQ